MGEQGVVISKEMLLSPKLKAEDIRVYGLFILNESKVPTFFKIHPDMSVTLKHVPALIEVLDGTGMDLDEIADSINRLLREGWIELTMKAEVSK